MEYTRNNTLATVPIFSLERRIWSVTSYAARRDGTVIEKSSTPFSFGGDCLKRYFDQR